MSAAAMPRENPQKIDTCFHRFNDLPREIRLLIWEAALPGPRIVHLELDFLPIAYCTRVWSDKAVGTILRMDMSRCR
jgi:hypothetical protein